MRLKSAAGRFDTTLASDAYNPATTFLCQYEPMSFSKIEGVQIFKRQVSVKPTVAIPPRGAITIEGKTYLVGHGAPDFWQGDPIRITLIIQGADGLASLNSIANELVGTAPATAYAALVFSKYMPDSDNNSKYPPQYQVFLSGTEDAPSDSLIHLNSRWFLVKQSYLSTSGLRVALANELEEPTFETISFGSKTYDPITDTSGTSASTVKILRVKWSEHFTYLSQGSENYQRGDQQIFVPKTVTPKPSDTLTLSDGVWRILSVQNEATWSCHARRA